MLFYAHSGVRYLILLFGGLTLAYALFGVVTRRPFDRRMGLLSMLFAGSLHLQILLGVALLLTGTWGSQVAGHVLTTVFAAVVAQLVPSVMRRRPPEERTYAPFVVSTVVALGLVVTGVMALGRPLVG